MIEKASISISRFLLHTSRRRVASLFHLRKQNIYTNAVYPWSSFWTATNKKNTVINVSGNKERLSIYFHWMQETRLSYSRNADVEET